MQIDVEVLDRVIQDMKNEEQSSGKTGYPELNYVLQNAKFREFQIILLGAASLGMLTTILENKRCSGDDMLKRAEELFSPLLIKFSLAIWKTGLEQGKNARLEEVINEPHSQV